VRRDVLASEADARERSEGGKPSPKPNEGAVCVQWVRCGRSWCRCMHGGPKHGPYYARYWWCDGRRYKRYVRQGDAQQFAAACVVRRETERDQRARAEEARQAWRDVLALIREIEHGER
jgi:hypothetical protein